MYFYVLYIQVTQTIVNTDTNIVISTVIRTDMSTDANIDASTDANTNVNVSTDANTNVNVSTDANTDANVSTDANTDANVSTDANTDANVSTDANTDANVSTDANTDVICSICYDIILPVQSIQKPCENSHIFHKDCFSKFRKTLNYNNKCPYCRSDVKLQQMIPKGTCKRLKESNPILEEEKAKLNKLIDDNRIIEKTIKKIIFRLNIDISHINKEERILKYNKIKTITYRQLEWRIEQKKRIQNLEKECHKKYLKELFKVIEENDPNYFDIPYLITQKNRIDNM